MSLRPGLGATYRLQLTPEFDFAAATAQVGYLARLGIETLYCSPVAEAVPGSAHGYDGTDPSQLRAELGGHTGFAALVAACAEEGLGLCIDLVPNHLATWAKGPWWRRLLAEGRDSAMGEVFDIDWDAPGADGKVLLPLLDRPLAEALAGGQLALAERDGETVLALGGGTDLPLRGGTPSAGDALGDVLEVQHYRLVDWHDPTMRNYRRFFDIDGLVGVRVERPEVFALTHALVCSLAEAGMLSALRVDHVDGLREPAAYLRRLATATGVPIVVEKILTGDEVLRDGWPVAGTTGYEVIDDIGGVFVEPSGYAQLRRAAEAEGDEPVGALTVATRRLVAQHSFSAELSRVAERLGTPAEPLREAVVRLPVYRTYLDAEGTAPEPLDEAVWRSVEAWDGRDLVVDALLHPSGRDAALRLQQLSGAVMAKGMEDTAWYRLAGPLAFCEVGGDPGRQRHDAVARLHDRASARASDRRAGLVPGTTHDTKRSADVRARLYALSELAEPFEAGLTAFRSALGLDPTGKELGTESRVLAQLLLGVLPPLSGPSGAGTLGDAGWPDEGVLAERVGAAMVKGAREAKQRSSWQSPDEGYEHRLVSLGEHALAEQGALLRASFGAVVDEVARLGAINALGAVVLRSTLPGVPDCYQGDEVWNLSLVDPDNRRPVDYDRLSSTLAELAGAGAGADDVGEMRQAWRDGRIKLLTTARGLLARREAPRALSPAALPLALEVTGPAADSVVAFARLGSDNSRVLAVLTRQARGLHAPAGDLPFGPCYAESTVALPDELPERFLELLSGRKVGARNGVLALDEVLAELPVALLVGLPG